MSLSPHMFKDADILNDLVNKALRLAKECEHKYVTVEHLFLAILRKTEIEETFTRCGIDIDEMKKDMAKYLYNYDAIKNTDTSIDSPVALTISLERVIQRAVHEHIAHSNEKFHMVDILRSISKEKYSYSTYILQKYRVDLNDPYLVEHNISGDNTRILEEYCTNFQELVKQKKIEPVIGREIEIQEITETLARKTKCNALLIGDPGTGKTALVEGLAYKIAHKQTSKTLFDHTVYNLEIGSILAGCKFRGEFEEKVKSIIEAAEQLEDVILFIDESHMMRGAGTGIDSGVDFSNMIKPALARGTLKIIASTTWEDFRKSFEKDRALMRRFNRIVVDEPTRNEAIEIVNGVKKYYEKYHSVTINKNALITAVDMSIKFITDKKLPDKALDLIDGACAKNKVDGLGRVTSKHITRQINKLTGIPIDQLTNTNEVEKTKDIFKELGKVIYGQDEALNTLAESIYVQHAGLREVNKPVGQFLFTGSTGCGKTEVAKQLANIYNLPLLRYDMSEYMEKHAVSKFIGAPPGYVGFDDSQVSGGKLLNDVEQNSRCVLLFDEIEKAHPDVTNVLLQVMDNGFLTGSSGKKVDFRNTIIIMTANLGSTEMEKNGMGFLDSSYIREGEDTIAIDKFFPPEFRNRLDAIVRFKNLEKENVVKIVDKFINELNLMLSSKKIKVEITEPMTNFLIDEGFNPKMGARPMQRIIDKHIKVPLSRKILFENLTNTIVIANIDDNKNVTLS